MQFPPLVLETGKKYAHLEKLGATMLPDASYLRAHGLQFRPLVLEIGENTPIFRKLGAAMLPDARYFRSHGLQFRPLVLETGKNMPIFRELGADTVAKTNRGTRDESQWIVAQRLLSTLTIPGFS